MSFSKNKLIYLYLFTFSLFAILIQSCGGYNNTLTSTPNNEQAPDQLRIVNSGNTDIFNLTVLFPGATSQSEAIRIFFGDISAGKVTDYKTVPLGVYQYAAYEYSFSGRQVNQYVVDWVGENPLQGERFTYRINLNTNNKIGNQIELLEVTVDAP